MSKSIEVSPKHGVNPCLTLCFFCGESKGIALMGRVRERDKNGRAVPGSDIEAPREAIMDYEPCDKCAGHMSQGVTLIGVSTQPPIDGRPPLTAQGGTKVYPTGSWCVLHAEAAQRVFNDPDLTQGKKLFVEHELLEQLTQNTGDAE